MSGHEDDDQDIEQEINVDVDSDSRASCDTRSDIDLDGGSCYDESETALGWIFIYFFPLWIKLKTENYYWEQIDLIYLVLG